MTLNDEQLKVLIGDAIINNNQDVWDMLIPLTGYRPDEITQAKAIAKQLEDSVDFLKFHASQEKDASKKSSILKEATAANNELDRINKEIIKR